MPLWNGIKVQWPNSTLVLVIQIAIVHNDTPYAAKPPDCWLLCTDVQSSVKRSHWFSSPFGLTIALYSKTWQAPKFTKNIETLWRIYKSLNKAIIGSDNGLPSHILNHCWLIIHWSEGNIFLWNYIRNSKKKSICKSHLQNVSHFVPASMIQGEPFE